MSSHTLSAEAAARPLTVTDIVKAKGMRKIAMLTAYDYPTARMVDTGGADVVLVGDSLGMVVLGRKDTVSVTLDEMIHHTRAVMGGVQRAFVVADLPFMAANTGIERAMLQAGRLVQESGVRAVKIEGGREIAPQIKAIVDAGIAVMGHIGLTPQHASVLGGFKVQAKTAEAAKILLEDALALQRAGCFSLVLEAVPAPVAAFVSKGLDIPTIGIGAGPDCDGQVLVLHDMIGLNFGHVPKFVKQYAELSRIGVEAVREYVREVGVGTFPGEAHSFSMPQEEQDRLGSLQGVLQGEEE